MRGLSPKNVFWGSTPPTRNTFVSFSGVSCPTCTECAMWKILRRRSRVDQNAGFDVRSARIHSPHSEPQVTPFASPLRLRLLVATFGAAIFAAPTISAQTPPATAPAETTALATPQSAATVPPEAALEAPFGLTWLAPKQALA